MRWPWQRGGEERRAITSTPWAGPEWASGGPPPWQGVSQERAMACIPVFGAVRFLADNIAALAPGLGLYKLGPKDIAVRQPTPSLFSTPSIHGTLVDWLHKAVISMGYHGDAIGLVTQRDYYGFPTMCEWLSPPNVVTLDRAIEGPGSYVDPRWYWWGRPMDPRDLLHIPWFCLPWRVRGLSPMAAFATTVGVNLSAQQFSLEWYNNGGVPPGTFRNIEQRVLPADAEDLMDRLTRRIRSRKPLVFGADWEYTPIAVSPNEAKFVETMQLTATQIATVYGVPPEKIGGTTGHGLYYNTVEQNSIDCLNYTFRPWLTRFEYAFSTCFPRGYFVRFDTSEFLRVDAKTRAEIDALSLGFQQMGWKSRDEVRNSYNLPPAGTVGRPDTGAPPSTGQSIGNGQSPPKGGAPTPGTSSAAAEPLSRGMMRDRMTTNGNGVRTDF